MATLFGFGFALATVAFYSAAGIFAPALWVLLIFTMMGTEVTLATFGAELFPTSQRSAASGFRAVFRDTGTVAGLAAVTVLFGWLGSIWSAISALAAASILAPALIWLTFPETAERTLEEISSEGPELAPGSDAPVLSQAAK